MRGSTTLYNDEFPNGAKTEQDEGDVVDGGVNVVDYAAKGMRIWSSGLGSWTTISSRERTSSSSGRRPPRQMSRSATAWR